MPPHKLVQANEWSNCDQTNGCGPKMANNMGGGGTPTTLGCTSGVAWVGGGMGGTT